MLSCGVASDSSSEGSGDDDSESPREVSRALPSAPLQPRRETSSGLAPLRPSSSHMAGFPERRGSEASLTREDLLEQGAEPSEADARLVRMHQDEVLMHSFGCWILCFTLIVSVLTPMVLVALFWTIIQDLRAQKIDCGPPLHTWVMVVCLSMIFTGIFPRVERLICRWSPAEDPRMPARVQIYHCCVTLFVFLWNCLGLHWTNAGAGALAEGADGESALPPCSEAAPWLHSAVRFYASLNLAYSIFMWVNMVGFAHVLQILMNRGLLRSSNAAPRGALEKNTEAVAADDAMLLSNPSCPVCLENFTDADGSSRIVRTLRCRHVFHKKCLQSWLKVNRTCPLCREDLGMMNAS